MITAARLDDKVICQRCLMCGEQATFTLTADEVKEWPRLLTEKVQWVFPYWSADKRELVMTGFHPTCFQIMESQAIEMEETEEEFNFGGSAPEWTL